jgi:hypothetical protein
MSSREEFEAWASKQKLGLAYGDCGYVFSSTEMAWRAWQAMEVKCAALAAENAALKSNLMFWDAEDPEALYDTPEEIAEACTLDYNDEFIVQVANRLPNRTYRVCESWEHECKIELVEGGEVKTPATDAFLAEVRAQGVEEFLRDSQLPYQIATVLADYDNVDDATLQTVIWSGQPPEPDGDVWHLEYVSRGNTIVRAILKGLREGVQS